MGSEQETRDYGLKGVQRLIDRGTFLDGAGDEYEIVGVEFKVRRAGTNGLPATLDLHTLRGLVDLEGTTSNGK